MQAAGAALFLYCAVPETGKEARLGLSEKHCASRQFGSVFRQQFGTVHSLQAE
jgi:hypothetical protein